MATRINLDHIASFARRMDLGALEELRKKCKAKLSEVRDTDMSGIEPHDDSPTAGLSGRNLNVRNIMTFVESVRLVKSLGLGASRAEKLGAQEAISSLKIVLATLEKHLSERGAAQSS